MPSRSAPLLALLTPILWGGLGVDISGANVAHAADVHRPPAHTAPAAPPSGATTLSPVDSSDYLVALQAARLDDHAEAARRFAAALAVDPRDAALTRQAFIQSALAGTPDAPALARAMSGHPEERTIVTAFVLGNSAILKQDWSTAAETFATMPKDALTRLLEPFLHAWSLAGASKADAAIQLLAGPGRAASPMTPFYIIHAGLIASVTGDKARAEQLFRQATTQTTGDDLLLARARANLLWQDGHGLEGRALLRRLTDAPTPLALASADLQEAITAPPVTTIPEGAAYAYVMGAYVLRQQAAHVGQADAEKQIDAAAGMMLSMALSLDPHLSVARLMLSEVEENSDHKDIALQVLRGVEPTDPLIRVARYRTALLQDALGDPVDARRELEDLEKGQPGQILICRALAMLLFEQKDWAGSAAAYDRAIASAKAAHLADWTLLFGRAAAYERAGDWTRSEADLQEARKLMPDEPLILNFLGYGWVQRGLHKDEAISMLQRAASLDPDDAAIRDSLGWALLENHQTQEGATLLEHAAEQTPLDPEVNYHLGVAYWRLGRKTEAIDQWNVALGLKPEPDDLQRIRKALSDAGAPASSAAASTATNGG